MDKKNLDELLGILSLIALYKSMLLSDQLTSFAVLAQYPKLTQPIGWTSITIILGLSIILVLGIMVAIPKLASVSTFKRRQQGDRPLLTCKHCNHQWLPRVPSPKQCPKCHSKKWR